MSESLFDDLLKAAQEGTDPAPGTLTKLAKTHGAESRAADEVAPRVILGKFRYAPGLGWLAWDGTRWLTGPACEERAREAVRLFLDRTEKDLRAEIVKLQQAVDDLEGEILGRAPAAEVEAARTDDRPDKALAKLLATYATEEEAERHAELSRELREARVQADIWLNLLQESKIGNVTKLCRRLDGVLTDAAELDTHHDLLNCHNGVVDLRTGELRPHDPELLITHLAGGDYDPAARCERFEQALNAVGADCREWFQMRMGQAMTGHTPDDDSLVLSTGGGENGKSTVMEAMTRAAGTYYTLVSDRVLLAQPGQHPTELMDLRGARLALMEETAEEGHLDTHRLKTIVGTPKIKARHMRQDTVEFKPTHSLFINTNHQPQVDATDHATWRRLKKMPWPFTFVKAQPGQVLAAHELPGDKTLRPYMQHGATVPAAALAWVVKGAMAWYAQRDNPVDDPAPVTQATREWRSDSDVAFQFATERLAPADASTFITGDMLRRAFDDFLTGQGKREWSQKLINQRFPASLKAAFGVESESKVFRCKAGDVESRRELPPAPVPNKWGDAQRDPHADERATPYVMPGKTARVWRGIRFLSEAEQNGGEQEDRHLRVVAGDASSF
ncbi:MAG: hypothetical protein JNM77_08840 [Pseudonocardia sp.]|nr:hypothetical protein [Pseudonocardia sp.]